MSIAVGLLILRLALGLLMIGHGTQKLFGWFGGHGLAATTNHLRAQGFKPASFWALLGGAGEAGGGLLLALGFLGPLGAIGILASMLMAVAKFHWAKGFWATGGGFEYPLVLLVVSLVLGLVGPGHYSLDTLFGLELPNTLLFWLGALGAVIVDAIGIVGSNQSTQTQPAGTSA